MGVDAALDFPLYFTLPDVIKGFKAPLQLANLFEYRKLVHRGGADHGVLISTHGEASRFFVTFLDNHDQNHRFRFSDSSAPHYFDAQVSMGMACLLTLQGVPALYYGSEQGLHGMGDSDQSVREALWSKPGAFDNHHPLFKAFQEIAAVRAQQPALRYGRQYFRGTSEDGAEFGIPAAAPGIIAFSRILHDMEVVIVTNPQIEDSCSGFVIIDFALNPPETAMDILYSNQGADATAPERVIEKAGNTITIHELAGEITTGPVRLLPLTLKPMEIQILGKNVDLKITQGKKGRMSRLSALKNTFRSKFASYFSGA